MTDDPIVQEIRQVRQQLLAECGGDLNLLLDRYKAAEDQDRERLVTFDDLQLKRGRPRKAEPPAE